MKGLLWLFSLPGGIHYAKVGVARYAPFGHLNYHRVQRYPFVSVN